MTKAIREQVYSKYHGRCAYCGRKIEYKDMQVDHLIPQLEFTYGNVAGDKDDISNLMPSCRICNHYKRAESLETFRKWIETIPEKLGERQYIYKVGMAYGFFDDTPRKVRFYFEEKEEWERRMGKIKVTCELKDYSDPAQPQIRVHNHWNIDRFVELEIDGKRYTVCADELRRAIENCTNVGF